MIPLPGDFKAKLGAWSPESGWAPVEYDDLYTPESISGVARLLVAPKEPLQLLKETLPLYGSHFSLVYLLITPPSGYDCARYEIKLISLSSLLEFLDEFGEFLGTDARHHLWIHALEGGGGTIIWDEHDWLYYYGNLVAVESALVTRNFRIEKPEVPFPHLHNESAANLDAMESLLGALPWVQTPVSNLGS